MSTQVEEKTQSALAKTIESELEWVNKNQKGQQVREDTRHMRTHIHTQEKKERHRAKGGSNGPRHHTAVP